MLRRDMFCFLGGFSTLVTQDQNRVSSLFMFILTRIARDTLVVHGIHGYSARVPIPFEVNAHK